MSDTNPNPLTTIEQLWGANGAMARRLVEMSRENSELKAQNAELKTEVACLKHDVELWCESETQLDYECHHYKRELETRTQQLNAARDELAAAKAQIQRMIEREDTNRRHGAF